MRLDHVLERFKAGAAIGLLTAGANAIHFRHAAGRAFAIEMLAHFLVAEGMAEADHHGGKALGSNA
jgi:hypothetical protein